VIDLIEVVDGLGNTIGEIEKRAAHEGLGVWHRAISVLLFNTEGEVLVQQRANTKYHFPGLWANSCCSHPSPRETPVAAAKRTLLRELGITAELEEVAVMRYEATDPVSGLTEREHDHIFTGTTPKLIVPNPQEVQAIRWVSIGDLRAEIAKQPERFAPWLPLVLDCL